MALYSADEFDQSTARTFCWFKSCCGVFSVLPTEGVWKFNSTNKIAKQSFSLMMYLSFVAKDL